MQKISVLRWYANGCFMRVHMFNLAVFKNAWIRTRMTVEEQKKNILGRISKLVLSIKWMWRVTVHVHHMEKNSLDILISLLFVPQKKVWNDMRKWWHNFHFCVNYPFNSKAFNLLRTRNCNILTLELTAEHNRAIMWWTWTEVSNHLFDLLPMCKEWDINLHSPIFISFSPSASSVILADTQCCVIMCWQAVLFKVAGHI